MKHLPHTNDEISQMLKVIGAVDIENLFRSIPKGMRCDRNLALPQGMSEPELLRHMSALAMKNRALSCSASFLGAGAYRHYVPAAVLELASRSEFVTPYTPYQPEISQGTLQALFEYQSLICRLFEMDVANASHYSGATACADAVLMAQRIVRDRSTIVVCDNVHPEYRDVVATVLGGGRHLRTIASDGGLINREALKGELGNDVAAVLVQFPNFFGIVEDLSDVQKMVHEAGALLIAAVPEPISLGILTPPGVWGADIAVGEGLSLGLPTSFGGPGLGIFTVRQQYVRQMPGRICGRTTDADGRTGYVLTLSTREQHIRREKATSNICSNQALCATTAAIYLSLLGGAGMRKLATINAARTAYARKCISAIPQISLPFAAPVFNEFVIETKWRAADLLAALAKEGIFGGVDLGRWYPGMENRILVCVTEMNTNEDIARYTEVLRKC